jgi:DNA (cytosine-5)-methyltransferase 1
VNYIDLFAGASGMSEGFVRAGYNPIAHIEMNPEASNTIRTRTAFHYLKSKGKASIYYSYLSGDITRDDLYAAIPHDVMTTVMNTEISEDTIPDIFSHIDYLRDSQKIDLVIGGPPCQAYSIVGRSRDPKSMKWDRRNFLFRHYAEFLKKYRPNYFIFENVLGLLSAGNSKYFKEMLKLFSEIGYSVDFKILKSEHYGVLQKRRRVIIIGRKGRIKFDFPHIFDVNNPWQTKKDLFYDLPTLKPGQEMTIAKYTKPANDYLKNTRTRNGMEFVTQHITRNHNDRDLEIYSIAISKWVNDRERLKYYDLPGRLQTHKNTRSFLDRYKVVDPTGHSHTVMAHISKDGHYYIYPDKNQVRSLSVREAARLQSFPDDYFFEGGRGAAFTQIGNAVPPLMAEAIAKTIKSL